MLAGRQRGAAGGEVWRGSVDGAWRGSLRVDSSTAGQAGRQAGATTAGPPWHDARSCVRRRPTERLAVSWIDARSPGDRPAATPGSDIFTLQLLLLQLQSVNQSCIFRVVQVIKSLQGPLEVGNNIPGINDSVRE